jgi:hypothetical protein
MGSGGGGESGHGRAKDETITQILPEVPSANAVYTSFC